MLCLVVGLTKGLEMWANAAESGMQGELETHTVFRKNLLLLYSYKKQIVTF